MVNLQKFAKAAAYTTTSDTNWNGEFLMRGDNLAFMLQVKLIPFKPQRAGHAVASTKRALSGPFPFAARARLLCRAARTSA